MRPYAPDPRLPHGAYTVPAKPVPVHRPNRIAAGMSATAARSMHGDRTTGDGLRLFVHGTLDPLAYGLVFHVRRLPCACCGAKTGKLALRPESWKLARLRKPPAS